MKKYLAIVLSIVVAAGLTTQLMALQRQGGSERPSAGRPSSSGRTASSSSVSPSWGSSTSSSGTDPRSATIGRPTRSGFPGSSTGGDVPSVPDQTYTPNSYFNYSYWYDANLFVYQLLLRYRYLDGANYLWRYAQSDSPLTQEAVNLALSDSSLAADSLLATAEELESLITEYEAGRMGQKSFEVEVKRTTERVRDLSKQIRKDRLLEYLDQSPKADIPSYDRARSIPELRRLCGELHRAANEVAHGIDSYYEKDMTRVVDVNDFKRPSFGTMTKEIDRLAKAISKSADRL